MSGGAGLSGREGGIGSAVGNALFNGPLDGLKEVVSFGYIVEAGGGGLCGSVSGALGISGKVCEGYKYGKASANVDFPDVGGIKVFVQLKEIGGGLAGSGGEKLAFKTAVIAFVAIFAFIKTVAAPTAGEVHITIEVRVYGYSHFRAFFAHSVDGDVLFNRYHIAFFVPGGRGNRDDSGCDDIAESYGNCGHIAGGGDSYGGTCGRCAYAKTETYNDNHKQGCYFFHKEHPFLNKYISIYRFQSAKTLYYLCPDNASKDCTQWPQ